MPAPDTPSMLSLDPPDHRRLRALVNKAFTQRAVAALGPHVRSLAHRLLDGVDDPSGFDLMETVARPLPVIVIARMLGVPPEDRIQLRGRTERRARLLDPTASAAEREDAGRAAKDFDAYFAPLVEARRADPWDDILRGLVRAEEEGDRLDGREILDMLRLLLLAGHETTVNLIGNGVLALLRHPDQLERLRDDPALIPAAVEELLRYDSPVQLDIRRGLEDCAVNGFRVRRGDDIVLLIGGANRDPERFADPERFDVGRTGIGHLSFGRGIHHCLGAPLARIQGRIALEVLLERFASIRLAHPAPRFRESVLLRGLESLPVAAAPPERTRGPRDSAPAPAASAAPAEPHLFGEGDAPCRFCIHFHRGSTGGRGREPTRGWPERTARRRVAQLGAVEPDPRHRSER